MESERERIRRVAPVGEAFKWPLRRAQAAGVIVGTPLASTILLATHDAAGALRFALSFAAFVVAALATFVVALGPRTRDALQLFTWIGEHDLDRFLRETGARPPTSEGRARRWLEEHPTAPDAHRVDVLLLAGETSQARLVAEGLPARTPMERFERALQLEYAARVTGAAENADLAAAAAALDDPTERRRAVAAFAVTRAGRVAGDGGDWREPLVEARRELGREPASTFARSRLVRQVALVYVVVGAALCGLQVFW